MYGYKPTLTLDGKTYCYSTKANKSDDNFISNENTGVSDNLLDIEAQRQNSTL